MNKLHYLILLLLVLSCKKEEKPKPTPVTPAHVDTIAPCSLDFVAYDYDSIFHAPSANFPNAHYRIKFGYVNGAYFELAFNEVPVTGKYFMMSEIDPSIGLDHQVAYKQSMGALGRKSTPNGYDQVYVEANPDYLIISFCDQTMIMTQSDWTGNLSQGPLSLKVKKEF